MRRIALGLLFCLAAPALAKAGNSTATLGVSFTLVAGCTASTADHVAFASQTTPAASATATGVVTLACTNVTPYSVGLDRGRGDGATVQDRKMTGPSNTTLSYGLYKNASLASSFGNTANVDTRNGVTGGTAHTINVYGKLPAQSVPAAGNYADVVNVMVTF